MHISINGQPGTFSKPLTIAELLAGLTVPVRYVAVEVNGELVPRAQHDRHLLHDGDRVEVVTLTGGG